MCGAIGSGFTSSAIQSQFHVPKTFFRYIFLTANNDKNFAVKLSTCRPHKLTTREKIHILRISYREPKTTCRELMARAEVTCSYETIYWLLK